MPITTILASATEIAKIEAPGAIVPADIDRIVKGNTVQYARIAWAGLVLSLGEHNFYDDSDFFARVWNPEKGCPEEVIYASTRFAGGGQAVVDATPETLAAYAAWQAEERRLHEAKRDDYLRRQPAKGKTVRVFKGRKIPVGTVAEVIWFGDATPFGGLPRGGYKQREHDERAVRHMDFACDPREGKRVGLLIDGAKVFTDAMNVEVYVEPPASNRPGDMPWTMHQETGIPYERCLVMCNMD